MKASRVLVALLVLFVAGGIAYAGLRLVARALDRMRTPAENPPSETAKEEINRIGNEGNPRRPPAARVPRVKPEGAGAETAHGSSDPRKNDNTGADAAEVKPNPLDGYVEAPVNAIKLSDDADSKKGAFWLEQPIAFEHAMPADGKPILKLFAGLDGNSLRSLAVVLSGGKLALVLDGGKNGEKRELKAAGMPELAAGQYDLGVMWRGGEVGVWVGEKEVLTWTPEKEKDEAAQVLALPSAFMAQASGIKIGTRRALAFDAIRFDDNFMRQGTNGNGDWRPLCGNWELTAAAFAERSANPFSLRASFKNIPVFEDDPLNAADKRVRDGEYGIGIQFSTSEGTPHIVRITGGGPAAHAGLAEDDIFIRINGRDCQYMPMYQIYRELHNTPGELRLTIYRPGEKTYRDVVVHPQGLKWGVNVEGYAMTPARDAQAGPQGEYAWVTAGEEGWSEYEMEAAAKPLGAGGFGIAAAVLSEKDNVIFRWLGPHERNEPGRANENMLQLVQVKEGKETILASKPARYRPYEFYRMGLSWRGGKFVGLIDRNEILSAELPGVKRGKIGLWALKGNAVFFDDVHVAGDRTVTAAWRTAERSLNTIFALEDDMEVWANPALEWDRDLKTGWAVHHQRFPGDQAISLTKPRFNELNVALYCGDDPEARACPRLTIKDGVAELGGEGLEKHSANVGKGPFQKISMDAGAYGVRATIDGKNVLTSAWAGTKPHLSGPRAAGLGERLAIRGLKNLGDPATVRVTSSGTLEYTFDNAPSDWKVSSGRWGQLNKWICDPRWSWFGGRTKTAGTIWNKHVFSGDVSVDAHVSTMMMRDDPPFERPGDFNLTICGDGENLDSGYTLIFGGDLNSWTRLYRKGVQVAEATDEKYRVFSDRIRHPDKPDLHQRWFHLKLEKIGDTVSFYRDGLLAFKFVDPEPLVDGRVAFWTMDNGFLLSRLRIAHGGAKPAPFEDGRCGLYEGATVINMFDGEYTTDVRGEAFSQEIADSINAKPNAFKAASSPPWKDRTDPNVIINQPIPGAGYRVTNGIGGGPFALQFKSRSIDLERESVVRFAYRIEPGAMVDLYLIELGHGEFDPRHQGCYRWQMSGPVKVAGEQGSGEQGGKKTTAISDELSPLVGEIPGVMADGNWHTVQFDLYPSWQEFWRSRNQDGRTRAGMRLMFGNLDNTNYLLAGMNGNHAGAVYAVSDVKSFAPSAVATQGPRAAKVIWPYDAEGDGHSVKIVFSDPDGSGVNPATLKLVMNGFPLPNATVKAGAPCRFNSLTQTLTIDCLKIEGFRLAEGSEVKVELAAGFENRAGKRDTAGFSAAWTYHVPQAQGAKKAVYAPVIHASVAGEEAIVPGDVALTPTDVTTQGQTWVRVQPSKDAPPWAPAGQQRSIEAVATNELTSMGFALRQTQFDLQRWPYMEMEYRVPLETPFNMLLHDEGNSAWSLLLVKVEDARDHLSNQISGRFGPAKEFVADGTWRRSTIPVLKYFNAAQPEMEPPKVYGISFEDRGWKGGRRGLHWQLHKLQPVPAGKAEDLTFSWGGEDVTGAAEFEVAVDGNPEGGAKGIKAKKNGMTVAELSAAAGVKLKDGWNYVHVRMKNGAGLWSEAAHRKFFLDTSPPRVVRTEPADGAFLAGQTFKIFIEEEHGVSLKGATLKIDGDAVTGSAEYVPGESAIVFNASKAGRPFLPGDKVSVELSGLADNLGNVQKVPHKFKFTKEPALKQKGPEIASFTYAAPTENTMTYRQYDMELSFGLNFEEYVGHVHAMRDCKMDWVDDAAQACSGKRAVKFTCLQDDGDVQIMLHKNAWFVDKLPLVHFDYKAEPGFNVDLVVETFDVWNSMQFTGTGHAPNGGKALGKLADIVADGQWHHASVDLRAMLDKAGVKMPSRIVNKLVLSSNGEDGCKKGATLTIDNLDMAAAGGTAPRGGYGQLHFKAKPTAAGIDGYSYAVDQEPDTVPPARVMDRSGQVGLQIRYGVFYAHVRACDQAGNWGETKTIRLEFGQAGRRNPVADFEEN